jgi:organic radical activating enzyme
VIYSVAERFKSIQGEGLFAGTPMAFIRFVGCSVGKKVCHACDTDFEKEFPWLGGGQFSEQDLEDWVRPDFRVCLTGGEPLNQDLDPLLEKWWYRRTTHIETSGTVAIPEAIRDRRDFVHLTVSPKPGFLEDVVADADEVKVIVPGLGTGEGWPTISDALRWAENGKTVFLQPRNAKFTLDIRNARLVQEIVLRHPQLRMSNQQHKAMEIR